MTTPLDSTIFGPLFTDPEVSALFTDEAYVRALLDVEVALARAQARVGVIPQSAAAEIARAASSARVDLGALREGTVRSGFPVIALIHQLRNLAGPSAESYVHWGATTQDIMDTACVLTLRTVHTLLGERLRDLIHGLAGNARRHRSTVLAARTHAQQALPFTFGLKIATWLAPLIRHAQRLDELAPRLFLVQFGGAAGTLAALGNKGLAVMEALAAELKLGSPAMPWHTQRDGLVEFAGCLSLITGSLGKMAQDIILLAQTEVDEVAESDEKGRGGSSTMPQKSNPITSELILAAARANASLLSAMHHAQIQEHERATHGWQLEWLTLPQMIQLSAGALKHGLELARHLQVSPAHMRANIERGKDLILAEAAVFALVRAMPRADAEVLVKNACAVAVSEGKPLIEAVEALARGSAAAGAIDWRALAAPENYLGEAEKLMDRVLERAHKI